MRNKIPVFLVFFSLIAMSLKAQNKVIRLSSEDYKRLKEEGSIDYSKYTYEIDFKQEPVQATKIKPVKNHSTLSGNIACNIIDQSTVPAVAFGGDITVDDQSTLIDIPFNFCFYGTNYSEFYLNSNGNITFGSQYTAFTATGFPTAGPRMIAPFWADFDNRPSNNGVARVSITSTSAIITWDSMGYYNSHADLRNTCQLIITEGTDPILPAGYNVGFLYENMDWTTGDASSGTNGFGGTAATVGINEGDGTTYVQVGRFDSPGSTFVSNTATNSGIDWLDYKVFFFNICTTGGSTNIAPIASDISFCDTIKICNPTDTLYLPSQFLAPEVDQTNTILVTSATLGSNMQVTYGTPGSTSDVLVKIYSNPSLLGYHIIDYRSIDNGTPPETTIVSQVIHILTDTTFNPSFQMPASPVCSANAPYTVSIPNCSDYSSFRWMDDSTGCSHTFSTVVNNPMNITVIGNNGCRRTLFDTLKINPSPVPTINGPTFYCAGAGTDLSATYTPVTSIITDYTWDVPGSTNASTVHVSAPGPVNLTVTDSKGCTGTASVNITNAAPTVTISQSPATFCPGTPVTLTASVSGATSYTWGGGASGNTQSVVVTGPSVPTNCTVTALVSGCNTSDAITLTPLPAVTLTFTDSVFCAGETYTITAVTNPTDADVVWNPGGMTGATIVTVPGQTYTVQATAPGGGLCPSATETVMSYTNPLPAIGSIVDTEPDPYDTILCYKDFKNLTPNQITSGTAPFTYAWSPLASTNDTLKITQQGEYFLTVTDANGCTDRDSITVVLKQPTIALVGNTLICNGEDTSRIVAIGSSPNSYSLSWSPSSLGVTDSYGLDDTVYVLTASTYTATITDDVYGCQVSQTYIVNYYPEPIASFIDEPDSVSEWQVPVLFQNTSSIVGGTVSVYSWYFGDGDTTLGGNLPIHDYAAPGNYPVTLIVKSNKGCFDTVVVNHQVEVHLPLVNIMTPNGDNLNNVLEFKGLNFFKENKLSVFNRWGKKVYEVNNYDNKWDGDGLEAGTYYYILEVTGHRPESVLSSFFQIIR